MSNVKESHKFEEMKKTKRPSIAQSFGALFTSKYKKRTIVMHRNRLIIAESTVPKGFPPPTILQQSFGWLDENGRGIRYQYLYLNEPDHAVAAPPRRGQAPAAPGQPAARPDRIDPGAQ